MSDSGKAVFLSYASQDAEAARRIAESLRASGVEVWFDAEGGLEHGDEWDAKIRRQIKECVLFIAVISANTQAREEGYFRIEWDLAAERARGIASGVAFILPVVIDGTREPDALVPDRFRSVQWTKLPGGVVPPEVQARFLKLWSHRTGVLKHAGTVGGALRPDHDHQPDQSGRKAPPTPTRQSLWFAAAVISLFVTGLVAYLVLKPRRSPEEIAKLVTGAQDLGETMAAKSTAPVAEADQLVTRAYAQIERMNYTSDNLAAAEDLTRHATEVASDSARAWGARAFVNACYILRGWDISGKRRQTTQELANRALALDANEVEAMIALCYVLNAQGAFAQAEATARRGLALRPMDSRLYRVLGGAVNGQGRAEEALAIRQENVRLFPREPLTYYDLALAQRNARDFEGSLRSFEAALAIQPFGSALLMKTMLLAAWKGDLAGARATLEQVQPIDRTEDRAVGMAMWLALLERSPARVIEAGALTARPYFEDTIMRGTKAASLALAYQLDGKTALARGQWEAAEAVLRVHVQDPMAHQTDRALWAIALAGLGRTAEAAREFAPYEAIVQELPESRAVVTGAYSFAAQFYAMLGDAAHAVPYLRRAVNDATIFVTDHTLPIDPRWDKLRGTPEFAALLVEARARLAARAPAMAPAAVPADPAKADDKSVAVLAFENLSGDKDNEYFSDGISDELLNVLGKVPGLRVAGRTSAFSFKGKNIPEAEIAHKLGVAYVVNGTVQKSGTQVRITARLINAADGFQIWSDKFTDELQDAFALEDKIAGLIAQNLSLKLGGAQRAVKTVNPAAHRLVLEGWHFWWMRTEDGFARAETAFKEALAINPDFAQAHAGLANNYFVRGLYRAVDSFGGTEEDWAQGQVEASRAIELDPSLPEAQVARGYGLMNQDRPVEAEKYFQAAFALNPNFAIAHFWHSQLHGAQGRLDLALAEHLQALELDPLAFIIVDRSAELFRFARRQPEALATLQRSAGLRREVFLPSLGDRMYCLLALGRTAEAVEIARTVRRNDAPRTRWSVDAHAIHALQQAGLNQEAADYAAELFTKPWGKGYIRGFALAALGRIDEALPLLEQTPFVLRREFYWGTMFDPWRDDPRFQKLMAKFGYAEEYKVARATLARMLREQAAAK